MNKTLINLLHQNKAEKVGRRGREKKIPSGTAVSEEIPQEEQQPGTLRQCNSLAKSLNDESSDEDEDDGTACKICKIPWIKLMRNVNIGFSTAYMGEDNLFCSIGIGS